MSEREVRDEADTFTYGLPPHILSNIKEIAEISSFHESGSRKGVTDAPTSTPFAGIQSNNNGGW